MKSRSRSERISPLMSLAVPVHPVSPNTMMIFHSEGLTSATTVRMRKNRGKQMTMSTIRISTLSTHPAKCPAVAPTTIPMVMAMPTATKPTIREMRAPKSMRARTSRPRWSVPRG